jgi:hypothetical protein
MGAAHTIAFLHFPSPSRGILTLGPGGILSTPLAYRTSPQDNARRSSRIVGIVPGRPSSLTGYALPDRVRKGMLGSRSRILKCPFGNGLREGTIKWRDIWSDHTRIVRPHGRRLKARSLRHLTLDNGTFGPFPNRAIPRYVGPPPSTRDGGVGGTLNFRNLKFTYLG